MEIEKAITSALRGALKKLGIEGVDPVLDHPSDLAHGDYATNVALAAAKKAAVNPKQLAEKIAAELGVVDGVSKIEIAGPGFINFHLSRGTFTESISEILTPKEWGSGSRLSGKKIMYEYTDPNPFKVFHIGHLMSNAIGESLSRLGASQGATVFRANYQGDIGPHVAKCIWALKKEHLDPHKIEDLGKAYVIGSTAYEDDETAKGEIDAINKRLYTGDAELKPLYDAGRKTSL